MADERQQFTVAITCPNCGACGAVVWEESADQDRARGAERSLISLHGEFHRETGRAASGDPVIVCNACDEIQPD
jgi:hypothetical protein